MPETPAAGARLREAERCLAAADPVMAALIGRYGPCGLHRRRRDPFSSLVQSIVSQQISTRAADAILTRVRGALRAPRRFRPAHFADAPHATLRAAGLSRAKVRWLKAIAAAVTSGELSFRRLRALGDEDAIAVLDALPGVGRWTAEMFLIFALDRLDVFAMGDVGLRRSVNRLYGNGRPLSDRRTERIARAWIPYRSVASWFLWCNADPGSDSWY